MDFKFLFCFFNSLIINGNLYFKVGNKFFIYDIIVIWYLDVILIKMIN